MIQSAKMAELTALVAAQIFTDLAKANPEITTAEIVEQAFDIAVASVEKVRRDWVDPHTITLKQYGPSGAIVP